LEFDKNLLAGPETFVCLPLVGIILRLADILDFDAKRTPAILLSHLYVRHPISLKEWQKHRSVRAWQINSQIIQFNVQCEHPAIEAAIHELCDDIDKELSVCNNILADLNEFNKKLGRDLLIKLPFKVTRTKIETKKDIYNQPLYQYRDTKFNLSKKQVIDLLMGTKLYGNPEVALRELIQNSIDACLTRQAQERKWENPYSPEITVKYYSEKNETILEVIDNGTGMDQYIIDNYYTKVGVSFYKSVDFNNLQIDADTDIKPISRFGIGILSSFMVADILIVDTMRIYGPQKSSDAINLVVEGQDSIFWIKPGKRNAVGTTSKLILREKQNPWEGMSEDQFIQAVENVIMNPPFKINIETPSQKKILDSNSFRQATANSLSDYSWTEIDNVKQIEIKFENTDSGIIGTCVVAVLESLETPVPTIEANIKNITIDSEVYALKKKMQLQGNHIV
jgi:molecular chaperone HtpG